MLHDLKIVRPVDDVRSGLDLALRVHEMATCHAEHRAVRHDGAGFGYAAVLLGSVARRTQA